MADLGRKLGMQPGQTLALIDLPRDWPLTQVTTAPTFLGAAHPVCAATSSAGMTTMVLYVPNGSGRYISYTLEGGP